METVDSLCLKGRRYSRQIELYLESRANDELGFDFLDCFDKAERTYRRGIAVSFETDDKYSGASFRLSFASLLSKLFMSDLILADEYKCKAKAMLNWIVEHRDDLDSDVVSMARKLKLQIENADIFHVVKAMNGNCDFSGKWSDHWYECFNGHPYFVNGCGSAVEGARCIDCGAQVGQNRHSRASSELLSRVRASQSYL